MTRQQLIRKLSAQGVFWSYKTDDYTRIPDEILIEHVLRWADVPDILALFNLFPKSKIQKIWEKSLIPDERIYGHNYYLGKVFFDIKDTAGHIAKFQKLNNRYERLKKLTS